MIRKLIISLSFSAIFVVYGFAGPRNGPAAGAPVGIALSTGAFTIDGASVVGPIDVADGAELHTTVAPSDVHLENGVDVRLATRSAAALYEDRVILREGAVRLNHFDNYPVQVGGLTVQADTSGTEAIIRATPKSIEIASIGGTVRVSDAGALMTRVFAGTKMTFQNSGANSGQTAQPAQTGAAPAEKGPLSDKKAILWAAGICAVGAIVVGSIAAAQGKSPF